MPRKNKSISFDEMIDEIPFGEKWAYIFGTNDSYIIVSSGDVYSSITNMGKTNRWHKLEHRVSRYGYHRVSIKINNKIIDRYVHRLVLETFCPIENMENYDCAHLDDDKDNNNLNNLMWMTRFENNHWNDKIERGASKRRIPVFQYDLDGNYITSFEGLRRAEDATGFDHSKISNCARGKRKEYKGFIWSFIGPDNK